MVKIGGMMKERDVSVNESQMWACSRPPPPRTPSPQPPPASQDGGNWDFQRALPGHHNRGCPGHCPRGGG